MLKCRHPGCCDRHAWCATSLGFVMERCCDSEATVPQSLGWCAVMQPKEVFNAQTVSKTGKHFVRRSPGKGKVGRETRQHETVGGSESLSPLCREKEKARRVAKGRTRACPNPSLDVSLSKWSQMNALS